MWRPGQRVNNLDKLIDANLTVPTAVSENPLAATRCSEGAICAIRANVYDIVDENGFQEANSALPQDAPRDLARDVIHPPKAPRYPWTTAVSRGWAFIGLIEYLRRTPQLRSQIAPIAAIDIFYRR
jgi:hypothetical protein